MNAQQYKLAQICISPKELANDLEIPNVALEIMKLSNRLSTCAIYSEKDHQRMAQTLKEHTIKVTIEVSDRAAEWTKLDLPEIANG